MSLLDRYIHDVGRYLPRKKRADIQTELRSALIDSLEDRFGQNPEESQVAELLEEFGRPRDVAASYHPQGQYLVGPGLYPLFRMVAWIVVAAVLGAQLLAWCVAVFIAGNPFSPLEILASMLNSIPASLGWVLIVFLILQYFGARPALEDESWDPRDLPSLDPEQDLKQSEQIVGLVFGMLILVLVTVFPEWIGFISAPGGKFYPNPVILDYLVLIQVSLLANILFDIYLLWRGRWEEVTRWIKFALNIFSIVILALLVKGHTDWLVARNSGGLFEVLGALSDLMDNASELLGMHAFRLAFIVALVVTSIEVLASIYRFIRKKVLGDISEKDFVLKIE